MRSGFTGFPEALDLNPKPLGQVVSKQEASLRQAAGRKAVFSSKPSPNHEPTPQTFRGTRTGPRLARLFNRGGLPILGADGFFARHRAQCSGVPRLLCTASDRSLRPARPLGRMLRGKGTEGRSKASAMSPTGLTELTLQFEQTACGSLHLLGCRRSPAQSTFAAWPSDEFAA